MKLVAEELKPTALTANCVALLNHLYPFSTVVDTHQAHNHHYLLELVSSQPSSTALPVLHSLLPSSSAVFYWNTLLKSTVRVRDYDNALHIFRLMLRLSWKPDAYTFPFILKACGELPSFRRGACVHCLALHKGFVHSNVFVCNALVAMYGRCGVLDDAHQVFEETLGAGISDVVSWNSIAAAYLQRRDFFKVIQIFNIMVSNGNVYLRPDAVSLVNILPSCASLNSWTTGREAHGYAIRSGLTDDLFVCNALVDMYAKCGQMKDAESTFKRMKDRDVVTWNAMVTGYSQVGRYLDALGLFEEMRKEGIDMNVVTWSAVIAGYAQRGLGKEALDVFRDMMRASGVEPNVVTLVSVFSACATLGSSDKGRETHCYAIKRVLDLEGYDPGENLMLINALIDMYAKCNHIRAASMIFESMEWNNRNVVSWTVMIGGLAQQGDANDALRLFSQMVSDENKLVIPNAFTISCALVACARLSSLKLGRQIHSYVLRNRFESSMLFVANCLIDMYAKSGDVNMARLVFDNMSQRNTISWTTLMTGYGMHGFGEEALNIFGRMRKQGLSIDGVTFLVVLYACSHSGLVEQGINYFSRMSEDFGVKPEVEHYACMVDLLGRSGRFDRAMALIDEIPTEPSPIIWVALLGACRIHGNVDLAEYAADKLSELDSENDGTYTLLSNIYANARRWKDVARIRSLMKHAGIRKRPGFSSFHGKEIASFYVGDRSHVKSREIYNLLTDLIDRIKLLGYVPETSFALHDVNDEEKGDLLFEHSEKLALAYGILTSAPGLPIRITKNLRVCGDCHSAITYISKIVEHEIILRDSSRFHHFKDGSCSCKGYW